MRELTSKSKMYKIPTLDFYYKALYYIIPYLRNLKQIKLTFLE